MKQIDLPVGEDDLGRRLDRVLRKLIPSENLGNLFKALRKGIIRVNSKKSKPDYRICQGDIIQIKGSLADRIESSLTSEKNEKSSPQGMKSSIKIIWKNRDFLVINKDRGRLIHGPRGIDREIQDVFDYKNRESLSFKPGPLHRLDRNTSGILFFSHSLVGAQNFTNAMKAGSFTKIYLALLEGKMNSKTICQAPLSRTNGITRENVQEGEPAKSIFYPLHSQEGVTLAAVRLFTGRTHQIRCHGKILGHPLIGDTKYGGKPIPQGFRLHAWQFKHNEQTPLFPDQTAQIEETFFSQIPFSFTAEELKAKIHQIYGELS